MHHLFTRRRGLRARAHRCWRQGLLDNATNRRRQVPVCVCVGIRAHGALSFNACNTSAHTKGSERERCGAVWPLRGGCFTRLRYIDDARALVNFWGNQDSREKRRATRKTNGAHFLFIYTYIMLWVFFLFVPRGRRRVWNIKFCSFLFFFVDL